MSLAVNGLVAVIGWTAYVLLAFGPGRVPVAVVVVAGGALACCFASLLTSVARYGATDDDRSRRRLAVRRAREGERGALRR